MVNFSYGLPNDYTKISHEATGLVPITTKQDYSTNLAPYIVGPHSYIWESKHPVDHSTLYRSGQHPVDAPQQPIFKRANEHHRHLVR